jgi:hypothetical protein
MFYQALEAIGGFLIIYQLLFWILGKGFVMRLIKCMLGSGKPKEGWEFGGQGTREQWGTKGSSLQATWDRGGRFLSQLEGAK